MPAPPPQRILHVLAGATGGAARSAIDLMAGLAQLGIESSVACADFGDDTVRAALAEVTGGRVHYLPLYWWNTKFRSRAWKRPLIEARQSLRTGAGLASAARVAALAVRHGAQLIHTNTSLNREGARAARILGLPHVWHVRELIGPGQPFRFPLTGATLGAYWARHASMMVANSSATAALIAGLLPLDRLRVVPNGLDLSRFSAARPRAPGAPLVVGMVASLSAQVKKHALFVETVHQLPPGIEARIYGDVPEADAYASDIVARARGRVQFMGRVGDPAAIMRELDVLVQPSDRDSFGRVVVEAMAASLPVVAVRGGGAQEIVEDGVTGLLAPVDDPAGLARCVARLAAEPTLVAALGRAGRVRAEARYSIAACVAQIRDVYADAMARPVRR